MFRTSSTYSLTRSILWGVCVLFFGFAVSSVSASPPAQGSQFTFTADRTSLTAGQCTTLRWYVAGWKQIFVDGSLRYNNVWGSSVEPVQGTRQVCPQSTTAYSMQVVFLNGSRRDISIRITVSGADPPPQSQPQPQPQPQPQMQPPYGNREAHMNLESYCKYKYGSSAYVVMGDRRDAFSWSCYQGNQRVGGIDMTEVCRIQHPDLPNAVMLNRWDAYSWRCRASQDEIKPSSASCADAFEPNDDASQARRIGSTQIQATICPSGDVDIFKFNVSRGENVVVSLTNLPADYDIALFSENSRDAVGTSDNSDTADEEIRYTATNNDVLYVLIVGYDNVASTRPYTLTVRRFPKLALGSFCTKSTSAQLNSSRVEQACKYFAREDDFDEFLRLVLQSYVSSNECLADAVTTLATASAYRVINPPPTMAYNCAGAYTDIIELIENVMKDW